MSTIEEKHQEICNIWHDIQVRKNCNLVIIANCNRNITLSRQYSVLFVVCGECICCGKFITVPIILVTTLKCSVLTA